ncbi:MAG: ASKHA domain-containing protein [Kiritimatiellia bacterium]|jgi:uncharacterized 2Fe-2S/4Fe-4S cluster protein (DUF4445 family)
MPLVTFQPSGRTVQIPPKTELLDAIRAAGVSIDSPCGGRGTCGKCIVRIVAGAVDAGQSLGMLPSATVADGYVLACKTKVQDSNLTVEIPAIQAREGAQIAAGDETILVRGELLPKNWEYDSLSVKWCVDVPPPRLEDGLSDLDRLTRRIQREWGAVELHYPLTVIREVANALRAQQGVVTATLIRTPERIYVVRLEAGDQTTSHYGIAVDIGTTTVSVQLVNLALAEIVGTRSDYNDQIACGLDVIGRINYARRPDRLRELRERILATINRLICQVTEQQGIAPHLVSNAVLSGNTTMVHLLLGLNPEYIRLKPYTPTVLEVPYLTAAEVGIDIAPDSWIYISPSVGSYVGGDITAGVLCTDLAMDTADVNLFIDIGTNGELVVGNNEFLLTCACSAGPAFEGGGVDCGMRAALGAIERAEVNPEDGAARYWTIGNVPPKGICGSGMISLLADLIKTGWLDFAGKLNRARPSPAIKIEGRHAHYIIAPAGRDGLTHPVVISEPDIENIVRAKAAIYAACSLLVQHAGLTFGDLKNVYIGGGFGRFLDLEKAMTIGLIPELPREKYHYIGNSSLLGSYIVLVSQDYRQRQLELARRMTYVDLSSDPQYMDQYTGALFLPHTDPALFPGVHAALRSSGITRPG